MSRPTFTGNCPTCCDCLAPEPYSREVSAMRSRCGYFDRATNKVWLEECTTTTYNRPNDAFGNPLAACPSVSGSTSCCATYDPVTCLVTLAGSGTGTATYVPYTGGPSSTCTVILGYSGGVGPCEEIYSGAPGGGGCNGCLDGVYYNYYENTSAVTFSNEYTDSLLYANLNLPGFTGAFVGGSVPTSFTHLVEPVAGVGSVPSANGYLAQTVVQYYFAIPVSPTGRYSIGWDEVTTDNPSGGGTVLSTVHKIYVWDGVATQTPTYTLAAPGSNGSVSVENIVFSC